MNLYINGGLQEDAYSGDDCDNLDTLKTWAEMNSRPGDALEVWSGTTRLASWVSPADVDSDEDVSRWKCGECGGTVQGQAAPKICPECDAGDPSSVIRAQWTKEAA